jgi:hypothetical protein
VFQTLSNGKQGVRQGNRITFVTEF